MEGQSAPKPGDSLPSAAERRAQAAQLGMHPRHPVGPPRQGVDRHDLCGQRLVGHLPRRGWAMPPLVVARRGDPQHPAGHRDDDPGGGERMDQPEGHFGSTCSRAKNAAARGSLVSKGVASFMRIITNIDAMPAPL